MKIAGTFFANLILCRSSLPVPRSSPPFPLVAVVAPPLLAVLPPAAPPPRPRRRPRRRRRRSPTRTWASVSSTKRLPSLTTPEIRGGSNRNSLSGFFEESKKQKIPTKDIGWSRGGSRTGALAGYRGEDGRSWAGSCGFHDMSGMPLTDSNMTIDDFAFFDDDRA